MKGYKLFSFLVVITLVCLLNIPINAAGTSGACGDNLSWSYDAETTTLTITGQGEMDFGDRAPWMDYSTKVTRIVIADGVTTVGSYAFSGFTALSTVSMPSTITTIGQNAFYGCYRLENISLTNVTSIGKYAFSDCRAISEITIPAGVTCIEWGAFSDCSGIKTVQFHDGITEIGGYAFSGCNALTSVTIPDSVKTINDNAFSSCYRLSSVILSKKLTTLGGNVFQGCPNLKRIVIPDSLTKIKTNTFTKCSALEEVVIGTGVSSIEHNAFDECHNLTAFTLKSGNASFSVDRGVLYNHSKTELKLMPRGFRGSYEVLPGTVKISKYSCDRVPGLTAVVMPNSVTTLGNYAFNSCSGMTSITLSNNLQTIGGDSLSETGISEIFIPATVTEIKQSAFCSCSQLSKVTFAGEPPRIATAAFTLVKATVYYPGNISAWNDATGLYGGILKWVSVSCKKHNAVTDQGKSPTCTESGMSEGSHCSVCHAVIVAQKPIPAKGHSYAQWTKENEDVHKGICTVCGKEQTAAHTWDEGAVTSSPTCQDAGIRTYHCADCDATKDETLEPTDHTYSGKYCFDKDSHWEQCATCEQKKNVTKHVPGSAATEENAQTCTVCGFELAPATETNTPLENTDSTQQKDALSDLGNIWWLLPVVLCFIAAGIFVLLLRKRKQG